MAAVISSGVKTTGTGAAEVTGTGKSGAPAVVAIGAVVAVGSGRVGVGGGEDMIAPKLPDTKLIGTGSLPGRALRL
jgi:hypothetical protein